jgi:hypothetical protein
MTIIFVENSEEYTKELLELVSLEKSHYIYGKHTKIRLISINKKST